MMNEAVYQQIYDELSQYLLADVSRLVIYLEYGEGSYSFSFYEKSGENYIKCYDLPGVTDEALLESFSKIDRVVTAARKDEKDLWTSMTMVVDATGNLHIDFDYSDPTEDGYSFKVAWKKKYLV